MDSKQQSNSSSNEQVIISLQDVQKNYGRRLVLHVPEFSVRAGEAVALVGQNGSGKSTLLRLLAGSTRQTRGRVGRSTAWRQARIGAVPQSGGINPDLTVSANLRMYRRLYGRDSSVKLSDRTLVREFGLVDFLEERAGNLSGGFKRILAIVSMLDVAPDGLLLDEPFSGLDRHHSERLLQILNDRGRRLLFLVVTGHADGHLPRVDRRLTLLQGHPQ